MTKEEQEAAEVEAQRVADEAAAAEAEKKSKEKSDDEKTADEIEAEAKELEKAAKAKKEEKDLSPEAKEAKKKSDQLIRRDKAKAALEGDAEKPKEIAIDDSILLGVKEIDPESETAKVLQKYVEAGIVKNYKEGLGHPGVMGELNKIKEDEDAKTVIDENDSEDAKLATKKERVANYRASGDVPSDVDQQKEIADANLEEMGLK